MCGPAAIGAVAGVGQAVVGYQAEVAAVNAQNRAKLKNFERQNVQYITDVMLDNAQYKQDQIQEDVEQDKIYQNMINEWRDYDSQLDDIFSKGSFKLEAAIREMHQNDYAGTQTGATAARLAGKSTKEMGFKKAEYVHDMLMAEKRTEMKKDISRDRSLWDSWDIYEKVRYSPIHGHTPVAPTLAAKPSPLGAIFGAVGSAMGGFTTDDTGQWTVKTT
tara:strand:+ start:41 stop:694 length:654 start_codon:yes stop_codon:yes gene_type:complete